MSEGNKSRTVAATNMNSESSRSHAVFNITLTQTLTDIASDVSGEKVSKISLVDLAGSERVHKTGSSGERLREGSNINKSLTTLGLVISHLADQSSGKKKNSFVPYRDSVLTWLLKECLGGNSKTVMVATVSPAADNYEESLSTLRYADRAKRIVNNAVINEDPNAKIIRELREEVDMLKKQLKEAESMKADSLKDRLEESEKLMKEMSLSWEEKLVNTERIHKERQAALEQMGISVQTSGIKVERNKCFLVNLNADPSLNELLVYYLKDHNVAGRPDEDTQTDIQLNGLGIMPRHCTIDVENEIDVYITPCEHAKVYVNGSAVTSKTSLRHGDRILLGNYHFFRINCPRAPGVGSSGTTTPEPVAQPVTESFDFDYAQNEVMMQELHNDPVQAAMKLLEDQHQKDKDGALSKQREAYEQELAALKQQLLPKNSTGHQTNSRQEDRRIEDEGNQSQSGDGSSLGMGSSLGVEPYEEWSEDRDDMFRQSLAKLREDVVKANALIREANFLGEEMGKQTEFRVTLQIPACNLTPNRKRGAIVSEPAIQVKRKDRGTQIWSVEKLENKIIDMRDMYNDRKDKGIPLKDEETDSLRKLSFFESQDQNLTVPVPSNVQTPSPASEDEDPFYESQENHCLIGVANVFLEVLFHDVKLNYGVPIISQQGEVAGKLNIEIQRISGSIPDVSGEEESTTSNGSSGGSEGAEEPDPEGSLAVGAPLTCRLKIKEAYDLPLSLAHFVFCQYTFFGKDGPTVVPPYINPDVDDEPGRGPEAMKGVMKFNHTKEFTVNVTEEFIEHALEGSLAVEVWGHRVGNHGLVSKPGWEIDSLHSKSRSLADRPVAEYESFGWTELIRKIELWVEIHELNEQGEYVPVESHTKPEVLTGGIFQIRQGHSRRILVRVKPVQNSGTLPIICEAITSISVGSICARSKLQKGLDSYQDGDLTRLRERWSDALMKRREYLDEQIHKIMHKPGRTQKDTEREASLINQWVSLTEERNAVLVPAPESGVPGAPANWNPPAGMETHIPVLFLDIETDEMGTSGLLEGIHAAGYHSILPKELGTKMVNLPIIKYYEKDVCACASWDSSLHDSPYLNRNTNPNERIYLIVKAVVQLSHPATMELVVRKRICVNIYKKQGFATAFRRRLGKGDTVHSCGVTYEIVSNIPKASEDPEDRESLALMAAAGAEENGSTGDGETYIEKYTRGVSAVESILALDRLRQEVIIKEKLASRGRNLRKTSSVPNIPGSISRNLDMSRSMDCLDEDFRILRWESLRNLGPPSSPTLPGSAGSPVVYSKATSRPRTLQVSSSDSKSETSDYCSSPGSMQFNSSPGASPSHPNMSHAHPGMTSTAHPLMGGVHPSGGPILPSMSPLLPSMGTANPRRSSTGKSPGGKQLRPVQEESRAARSAPKMEAKTLYYVQKRHRAIKMSEEKINRRRSEPPHAATDAKSTPPKSDVFHSDVTTALNRSAEPSVGRKNPFLRGDLSCDGSATDDRLVYLPSQEMEHPRTILRTSHSWNGPLEAGRDATNDENEQNDLSFHTPPPVPGIDSSTPVHSSSESWDVPLDQRGKGLRGGGDVDDMYLTFGSCSLSEPIYANEVCSLVEDQPIFIKPKWVCQEQKF
ncbi:kinesin-like protein KIF13A isoform X2 [Lytechinus pictus]|uniref:kinesin-like protein KIF13A isoform X2 n=1 Tax=Lytechinus pictus TaxID=7653 RepID=UPI0030B9EB4D